MEIKESLRIIINEIDDITNQCRLIANQCVEKLLYRINIEGKSIGIALLEDSFLMDLRNLAVQICRIDRLHIVEYDMALLTFPIHSFLKKEDYETVEVFLQEYLSYLSLSIIPEEILLGTSDSILLLYKS